MSGLFQITVEEAQGQVAVSADIDNLAVVLGIASALPTARLTPFFGNGTVAKSATGHGDAVDCLCQIIEQKQGSENPNKRPACLYSLPIDTPASYGAIDVTAVTGTAVVAVDGSVLPYGTYEGYVQIMNGGFIGTSGITYVSSLDNGRNPSPITGLGTATSLTIAEGNVKLNFSPTSADLSALNTLINDLFTKANAHFIDVASSIHGAADTADEINGTTYPSATDSPTRIARVNAIRQAYSLHRVKTAGGVHGAVDATNVIVSPLATDDSSALVLALELKTKLNAHEVLTTGGVHGSADNTNTVTASNPTAGALVTGDIIRIRTKAPKPSAAAIDLAFAALAQASLQVGLVFCEFDVDSTLAAHLTSGKSTLAAAGKDVAVLYRTRIPDAETSETESAWAAAITADLHNTHDSGTVCDATFGLVTDAMTGNQYLRSDFAQWAADVVRINRVEIPDVPSDRPEANFTLITKSGALVGHDEGPRGNVTGLSDDSQGNRFRSTMRFADQTRIEDVFSTVPWTMYGSTDQIFNLPTLRVCNAIKRVARSAGTGALGGRLRYTPATSTAGAALTYPAQNAVHGVIYDALKKEFSNDIQNIDDASLNGLVQVNPAVTVSAGNLLKVSARIKPVVFGYLVDLDIVLAIQQ